MNNITEARRQAIKQALEEVFLKAVKAVSRSNDPSTLEKTIRAKREVFLPHARLSVRLFEVVELIFNGAGFTPGGGYCSSASQMADIELSYHKDRVDIGSLDESVDSKIPDLRICVPDTGGDASGDRVSITNGSLKISFIKRKPRSKRRIEK